MRIRNLEDVLFPEKTHGCAIMMRFILLVPCTKVPKNPTYYQQFRICTELFINKI